MLTYVTKLLKQFSNIIMILIYKEISSNLKLVIKNPLYYNFILVMVNPQITRTINFNVSEN